MSYLFSLRRNGFFDICRGHKRRRVKHMLILFVCAFFLSWWILLPLVYEFVINVLYIFVLQRCMNGDLLWKHMTFEYIQGNRYKDVILRCIPSVPNKESPIGWHVPVLEESLSKVYLELPMNQNFTDHILVLSPLRDASRHLQQFSTQLEKLRYPHNLVSICFGEEGSVDNTLEVATKITHTLKHKYGFRDAKVYKLPINGNKSNRETRHFLSKQLDRRRHLARARNLLTKLALTDEKWILWIDSDVHQFRSDLTEQFLFSNKDVMTASTLVSKVDLSYIRTFGVYDRNTRRIQTEDDGQTQYSLYLNDLKAEGREAKVDLVGACALMIRAECVRKGLVFPEEPYMPNGAMFAFEGLESEGLGQLANDMGFQVYGLPFLELYHLYDPPRKEGIATHILYFIYRML